jgi:hypothetical protein
MIRIGLWSGELRPQPDRLGCEVLAGVKVFRSGLLKGYGRKP